MRVRSLRAQDTAARPGHAGQRTRPGPGWYREVRNRPRHVAAGPALHAPTCRFDATPASRPASRRSNWTQVHLHLGAEDVPARIALLGADEIPPGGEHWAQITLERDIGALAGDRFILRDARGPLHHRRRPRPRHLPPTRKKRSPERLAMLCRAGR